MISFESSLDEVSDHRPSEFRCIGHYGMPAIGKPFELNQMRRKRRRDVRLALDRMHRIVLTAEHQGRTLNAMKIGKHVERVALHPESVRQVRSDFSKPQTRSAHHKPAPYELAPRLIRVRQRATGLVKLVAHCKNISLRFEQNLVDIVPV